MPVKIITPSAGGTVNANDLAIGKFGIVVGRQFRGHVVQKYAAGVIDFDDPNNLIAADFELLVQPQPDGFTIEVSQG